MPTEQICSKCDKRFTESDSTPNTSIYFYKGKGDEKQKAVADSVCLECISVITSGWKHPPNFVADKRQKR